MIKLLYSIYINLKVVWCKKSIYFSSFFLIILSSFFVLVAFSSILCLYENNDITMLKRQYLNDLILKPNFVNQATQETSIKPPISKEDIDYITKEFKEVSIDAFIGKNLITFENNRVIENYIYFLSNSYYMRWDDNYYGNAVVGKIALDTIKNMNENNTVDYGMNSIIIKDNKLYYNNAGPVKITSFERKNKISLKKMGFFDAYLLENEVKEDNLIFIPLEYYNANYNQADCMNTFIRIQCVDENKLYDVINFLNDKHKDNFYFSYEKTEEKLLNQTGIFQIFYSLATPVITFLILIILINYMASQLLLLEEGKKIYAISMITGGKGINIYGSVFITSLCIVFFSVTIGTVGAFIFQKTLFLQFGNTFIHFKISAMFITYFLFFIFTILSTLPFFIKLNNISSIQILTENRGD